MATIVLPNRVIESIDIKGEKRIQTFSLVSGRYFLKAMNSSSNHERFSTSFSNLRGINFNIKAQPAQGGIACYRHTYQLINEWT